MPADYQPANVRPAERIWAAGQVAVRLNSETRCESAPLPAATEREQCIGGMELNTTVTERIADWFGHRTLARYGLSY